MRPVAFYEFGMVSTFILALFTASLGSAIGSGSVVPTGRPLTPLGRIIEGEGVVHFADAPDDPGYMASPGFRQAAEVSGMRSGITVPLRKDDALLGAITVYRQELRPFSANRSLY